MKYDCIFINGDSYSAPQQNLKFDVYGDYLSKELNIPVKNFAVAGSNNQRIIRTSIEYLNEVRQQYKNPLVIISWSFIRRLEVWYYGNKQKIITQLPDRTHRHTRLITLDRLLQNNEATLEQKILVNSDAEVHKQLTDFYTNQYLFAHFLESQNLDYFFFSAANNTDCPVNCFPYLTELAQVKWVENNTRIYKLHEFCISNWAKQFDAECEPTGHLSAVGHKDFSKFLLPILPLY